MKQFFKSVAIAIPIMILFFNLSNPQDWYLLRSEEYGYQIKYPAEPSFQQNVIDTELGKLTLNIYILDETRTVKNGQAYTSAHSVYPEGTIHSDKKEMLDEFFKGSVAGNVNNVNGKLLSEKVIEKDGFPGREIIISLQENLLRIKARSYLVKNTIYTQQVIFFAKNDSNPRTDEFLNSFELIK
jgi:hypothetical protein